MVLCSKRACNGDPCKVDALEHWRSQPGMHGEWDCIGNLQTLLRWQPLGICTALAAVPGNERVSHFLRHRKKYPSPHSISQVGTSHQFAVVVASDVLAELRRLQESCVARGRQAVIRGLDKNLGVLKWSWDFFGILRLTCLM